MSKLPIVQYPTFSCKMPSTGKQTRFRTYNVREEKLLIIALEAGDIETIVSNVKQVINNCTFGELDVDKLASFDIEYLFLQLRAKSVGEIATLNLFNSACPLKGGKEKCDEPIVVEIDITKVGVMQEGKDGAVPFDHKTFKMTQQVMLTPTIGVELRQPTFEDLRAARHMNEDGVLVVDQKSVTDAGFELVARCTTAVYDEETVYRVEDNFTLDELVEWYGALQPDTLRKIDEFFSNLPEVRHSCPFTCGKCGFESRYDIRGLRDFFV